MYFNILEENLGQNGHFSYFILCQDESSDLNHIELTQYLKRRVKKKQKYRSSKKSRASSKKESHNLDCLHFKKNTNN